MLALRTVIDAKPDVFNHNAETTPRLVFVCALTAIFERSYGFLSRIRGKHSQLFPFQ